MSEPGQPPVELCVVATLFRIGAVLAVVRMAVALIQLRIEVAFGVLGFWIAPGLLRGDRTWRGWALAFAAIDLFGGAVGFAAVIGGLPTRITLLHGQLSEAPRLVWLVTVAPWVVVSAWQLWVLTRPAMRQWFRTSDRAVGRVSAFPA